MYRWTTLILACGLCALASRAMGAIQVNSVTNYAYDNAYFYYNTGSGDQYFSPYGHSTSNGVINSSAVVSDSYNNQPYFPTMSSYAVGQNGTDFQTYIYAQGNAYSYSNPTSQYAWYGNVEAQGLSQVNFTLTEQVSAALYLYAYAYTDNPGTYGSNLASAYAQLYNSTTGYYYALSALSQNGSAYQEYATTIALVLDPGDYELIYGSSYTRGGSYSAYAVSGGSDTYSRANAVAQLYNIEATPLTDVVPEPSGLIIWSLLGLTIGGAGYWRRRKHVA